MTKRWMWVLAMALWMTAAQAGESGYLLRAADLKAKPFLDADTIVKLPEKTAVEIVQRQGPWMQVKVQGKLGFVRMLQVRMNLTDSAQARAEARRPGTSIATVSRPSGAATTHTTGVRGFDEQALKDARPDPAAFERMDGFATSAAQARQFAQSSPLSARPIAYYDAGGKPSQEGK